MPVIPLYDKLIVQFAETESVTEGGIVIPDGVNKQDQVVAVVTAIGEGRLLRSGELLPLAVDVGDHVIMDQFAGTDFEHDGEKFTVVLEDDIMAVIR